MGSKQSMPIKIFCFGDKDGIISQIFPKKRATNNNIDKWESREFIKELYFKEKETGKSLEEKIEWIAKLYPDIEDNENFLEKVFNSLQQNLNIPDEFDENKNCNNENDDESRNRSKNIIIKFGKKNLHYLINYIDSLTKTYLPQIAILTDEPFDDEKEGPYDNRYLKIIKTNNTNNEDLKTKLKCYYGKKYAIINERGNAILYQLPADKDKINTNNFINIMITGISRS